MIKKSFMRAFILFLVVALPGVVFAEDNPLQMEELTIQVLPEYSYHPETENNDYPPLLIGYHGALLNTTDEPLKGQVEIPLPTTEKGFKLGFVADYAADLSEMYEIEYVLDEEKGTISWETSREIEPQEMYKFVIEYYTESIQESEGKNKLEYQFTSFADIGLMNLIFVEPLKTEKFELEPAAETHQKNGYNMNMFLYQVSGMKAGEERSVVLNYERLDDRTTMEIMEEMAGSTGQQATAKKNEEVIPTGTIVMVIAGTALVGALILFFIMKRRPKKTGEKQEKQPTEDKTEVKKAKLRSMLIEGSITQEEYEELLKKIGGEK